MEDINAKTTSLINEIATNGFSKSLSALTVEVREITNQFDLFLLDILIEDFNQAILNYELLLPDVINDNKMPGYDNDEENQKRILALKAFVKFLNRLKEGNSNVKQNIEKKVELNKTELSEKIEKYFGFFNENCPRKHKQILKDEDFNKLINWTTEYFENSFEVPEIIKPIEVVNTNKTYVQLAFRYLFKELHASSTYPKTLFTFYQRAFKKYSNDKRKNFEAVKNNDEVKKLMKIEY